MGIVQLKIKLLKMSNIFAISLLLVSLHFLVSSVSGDSSCEDGYKSCEHKDHGDICIPNEETCSNGEQNINGRCKPLRSTRTCPHGQELRDGFCQDVDVVFERRGNSAVRQPGLLIGSRPCRNECTCEDKKGDKEGLSWCSFGVPENWGWCDHPPRRPGKKQSGSRPCVFPFKYNGVVYNECTD